ncbi:hypothetical protein R3P38DRAFT_3221313 [Favolaschia claudopus]|uniref:PPPDE domain-containing protein n=1 Tax=Favolaschia claudopus TaxID=2862362 RepID=A0AAV9ZZW9_9AGAR
MTTDTRTAAAPEPSGPRALREIAIFVRSLAEPLAQSSSMASNSSPDTSSSNATPSKPVPQGKCPNFSGFHHWGVVIGGMKYEVDKHAHGKIRYLCKPYDATKDKMEWIVEVGQTAMTNEELDAAARSVVAEMPQAYNLLHNNCQSFVERFLEIIQGRYTRPKGLRHAEHEASRTVFVSYWLWWSTSAPLAAAGAAGATLAAGPIGLIIGAAWIVCAAYELHLK